jgi:hypothetical protein
MSVQACKSTILPTLDREVDISLKLHLINHKEKKDAAKIGTTEQLKGVVKIIDSPDIANAIRIGCYKYPYLPKRQFLVACVDNWLDVRVWGIYTSDQIRAMEANRGSPQVNKIDWKILEISEELESKLRKEIIDTAEIRSAKQRDQPSWCIIL